VELQVIVNLPENNVG